MRPILLSVSLTSACAPGVVSVQPVGPNTWVEACGVRVDAVAGSAELAPHLQHCARRAARDDGGAIVRSSWSQSAHLTLPEPGTLGTPGFTLTRAREAVRVLPYDWSPRDLNAPHPTWLYGTQVTHIDQVPTEAFDDDALHNAMLGEPGTTVSLSIAVPTHPGFELQLGALAGHTLTVSFERQSPRHPTPAVRQAWLHDIDLPADDVAAALLSMVVAGRAHLTPTAGEAREVARNP